MKNNFNPFPEIETGRLLLRQLKNEDAEKIFSIRSDKSIAEYLDRPLCGSITEAEEFIKKINRGILNNESIYWVILLKGNNQFAGTICLWNFSHEESKADIGFELLTEYQGRGIMHEAAEKVIDYGFSKMQLNHIDGEVDPGNYKSIKLMEKFGFHLAKDTPMESKTIIYRLNNPALR